MIRQAASIALVLLLVSTVGLEIVHGAAPTKRSTQPAQRRLELRKRADATHRQGNEVPENPLGD